MFYIKIIASDIHDLIILLVQMLKRPCDFLHH